MKNQTIYKTHTYTHTHIYQLSYLIQVQKKNWRKRKCSKKKKEKENFFFSRIKKTRKGLSYWKKEEETLKIKRKTKTRKTLIGEGLIQGSKRGSCTACPSAHFGFSNRNLKEGFPTFELGFLFSRDLKFRATHGIRW